MVPPSALFLRSPIRLISELPREPAATDELDVLLSANDSTVPGVVGAAGTFLVWVDGGVDLNVVSLRWEASRSDSEPRDEPLLSETLGADVCGVGLGLLAAPI